MDESYWIDEVQKLENKLDELKEKLASFSDSAPLPCSVKELPLANEFYLGLEWFGAWLVDHAEGETVSEELVVQWCNQAWAKHLLKPNEKG